MLRPLLALAATIAVAAPALAQSTPTHVDATGALAGRSPHKVMRPIAADARCGASVHLPAGKLPTYGTPALDPRCGQTEVASAGTSATIARE